MKVLKVCYFVGFSVIRPTRRVAQLLMMMMIMMMMMMMMMMMITIEMMTVVMINLLAAD